MHLQNSFVKPLTLTMCSVFLNILLSILFKKLAMTL